MAFFKKYEEKANNEILALVGFAKEMGIYPYFKELCSEQGPLVKIGDQEVIMLGSNNYLGMTTNPKVKEAAKKAIDDFGVGSTGSRLLNGTMHLHNQLEERLAKFLGTESAVVFSTGMQANLGALSSFLCKDDWVISDEQNHASIIDGIRLGRVPSGQKKIYKHNDMDDLEAKLKEIPKGEHGLIVTDGIFSMEGDITQLDQITELAEQFGAGVYCDDAHAVGVLGKNGRGTASHFGVEDKVDIKMGTFSKSFASIGGYVAANQTLCDYLRHTARSFIFSASSPPSAVATVLAVLDIIEKDDSHRLKLWENAKHLQKRYTEAGFDIGNSESPIVPIIIGEDEKTFTFYKQLIEETPRSVYTNPVRPPAVPEGKELLRTSVQSSFTKELLDEAADIMVKHAKDIGII
ncbi:MAG: aminotransferase class I/II-fold pyridoxal phosphate-dependent enzyme [Candidatus Heimdallarchaeota archaeon]